MRHKNKLCKRLLTFVLSLAMVFTSVNIPAMTVAAADGNDGGRVENKYPAPVNGNYGAEYNTDTNKVTFWVKTEGDPYDKLQDVWWYEEYESYEQALSAHHKEGGNFINDGVRTQVSWNDTSESDGKKSYTITPQENTGAILYYFNPRDMDRMEQERILIIDRDGNNGGDNQGGNTGAEEPNTEGNGGGSSDPSETPKYINFDYIDNADETTDVDVDIKYEGTKATITGSKWGTAWGGDSKYQVQLKELIPVTTGEKYTVSFTITSEVERDIFFKLGDVAVNDTVYCEESLHLNVGKNEFTKETNAPVGIEQLMVLFALGNDTKQNTITITDLAVKGETSGYVDAKPYINFNDIDNADDIRDVDVEVKYEGTKATITGSYWGKDWGGDSKYQVQLKELIPVTTGEKYTVSFTITSEVERDIFFKLGDVAVDDTVYCEESLHLNVGKNEFTKETNASVDIEKLMVLFALGDHTDQNTITITKLLVEGETSGYVVVKPASGAVGPEYDFNDPNNAENDQPASKKEDMEAKGYKLIWYDEFDAKDGELDTTKWSYQLGDGSDYGIDGWGNKELQAYTQDKKNIGVNEDLDDSGEGNGLLRITASYEEDGYSEHSSSSRKYTSARIRTTSDTEALFTTTYGYIEARMSLPATKGAWPAFWMLPESTDIYGAWPVSGEIDIMETCGILADGTHNKACSTLHYGAPDHVYKGSDYKTLPKESDYTNFHTYAVDWEPGKMTFYYDGVPVHTQTNWISGKSGASDALSYDAPFDQPFYIILNLAVASGEKDTFGYPFNKASFQGDVNMYVDYVRVYQKEDGYAESTVREGEFAEDWASYAGKNQIADITASNLAEEGLATAEEGGTVDNTWYLATQKGLEAGGDARLTSYNANGTDWAKLEVLEPGGQNYSVQLIGHYNAKAGYVYKVSFDAYAEGGLIGATGNSDSSQHTSGWDKFGQGAIILGDKPQTYSYIFAQEEAYDNCRLEFNLGNIGTGTAYIGNVKVEIIDPAELNAEGERVKLADGNIIYNGTFDQGVDHIGYWNASAGTTLKVPRYTTEKLADGDVSVVDVASKTNYEKIADGVKYYERRAQISAAAGTAPQIYQMDLTMPADDYTLTFDMYSKANTSVKASIYRVNVVGETKTLGSEILSTSTTYAASNGVKGYSWSFTTAEDVENAALVFTFGDGSSVQIDNVKLIGESLKPVVDENPMSSEKTTWEPWSSEKGSMEYPENNGVVSNITSGGSGWYDPQLIGSTFSLVAGYTYELSFDYKMEGESNNKAQYIIETTGYQPVGFGEAKTFEYDGNGFNNHKTTFTATATANDVHMVFGFGNSAAKGATFTFKNLDLKLVPESSGSDVTPPEEMPKSYPITYILGSEDAKNADSNPIGYTEGVGVASFAPATRGGGFKFVKWSSNAAGTDTVTSIAKDKTGEVTLYAIWEAPKSEPTTVKVTGITLKKGTTKLKNAQTIKLATSESITLTATVTPSNATNKNVTWKSSKPGVATVNKNGKVTAKKKSGTTTITATAADGSGKKVTCKITVTPSKKVKLNTKTIYMVVKTSRNVKATMTPANSTDKLTWKSSKKAVATVNKNGKITAKKAGKTTITVTTSNKKTFKCTVNVVAKKKAVKSTSIKLNKTKVNVNKGASVDLVPKLTPAKSTDTIKWKSSKPKVASVDAFGTVVGKKAGKTKITATTSSGKKVSCTVTVKVPSTKVTLNKTKLSIKKGKTAKLTATMTPKGSTDTLTWTSSKPKVVSVDKNGKIKGLKKGTAKITVKTTSKKTATCTVTVK